MLNFDLGSNMIYEIKKIMCLMKSKILYLKIFYLGNGLTI